MGALLNGLFFLLLVLAINIVFQVFIAVYDIMYPIGSEWNLYIYAALALSFYIVAIVFNFIAVKLGYGCKEVLRCSIASCKRAFLAFSAGVTGVMILQSVGVPVSVADVICFIPVLGYFLMKCPLSPSEK